VVAIDDKGLTATVRLHYRPVAEIPGQQKRPFDFGVIGSDVGGIYIQDGHVVRIPPHSPVMSLMQHVVAHVEAETNPRRGSSRACTSQRINRADSASCRRDTLAQPTSISFPGSDQERSVI
jgi:hypothetical protein